MFHFVGPTPTSLYFWKMKRNKMLPVSELASGRPSESGGVRRARRKGRAEAKGAMFSGSPPEANLLISKCTNTGLHQ